jgi:hypothetical protein
MRWSCRRLMSSGDLIYWVRWSSRFLAHLLFFISRAYSMTGNAFRLQYWDNPHTSCVFRITAAFWIWTHAFRHFRVIWYTYCMSFSQPSDYIFDRCVWQVAVLVGELIGRYLNDWIMNVTIRRNKGVHEAESRLWCVTSLGAQIRPLTKSMPYRPCYLAVSLYVCGFVVLGASLQKKLSIAGVIMGWGIVMVAVMINTVAVCGCLNSLRLLAIALKCYFLDAYCNDCFPKRQVRGLLVCLQAVFWWFLYRAKLVLFLM